MTHDTPGLLPAVAAGHRRQRWWCRAWELILQLALILWVTRIVVVLTAFGLLILAMAPQAQDLFVEFARPPTWRMFLFLFVLVAIWAMPTHYAARLLLDTDARFQQLLFAQRELHRPRCPDAMARWVPWVFGLLTFIAVLIAIWRSHANLPKLDEEDVIKAVNRSLLEVASLVIFGA